MRGVDGETIFLLGPYFQGRTVSFREGNSIGNSVEGFAGPVFVNVKPSGKLTSFCGVGSLYIFVN